MNADTNTTRLSLPSIESVTTTIRDHDEMEKHLNGLKPEINALLYKWLPDSATILDMERIALGIFVEIHERWNQRLSNGPRRSDKR